MDLQLSPAQQEEKLGLKSNPFLQLQVMLRTAEKGSHAWYLGEDRGVPYEYGWQLGTMIKVQTGLCAFLFHTNCGRDLSRPCEKN